MVRRRNKDLDLMILRALDGKVGSKNDIANAIKSDRRTVENRLGHLMIKRKIEPIGGINTILYRLVCSKRDYFFCWSCGAKNEINKDL